MLYHFKISHMLFLPAGDHVTAGISDIRGVICWHMEKKKKKTGPALPSAHSVTMCMSLGFPDSTVLT